MEQQLKTAWNGVMDARSNPLRRSTLMTAHMVMQVLAWMWSAIFSVALGSYFVFGITVVGHMLVVAGLVITVAVFRQAELDGERD
ncbi:hypothetical protein [Marinovum sp.]|uniref:hypothetical protein n=1 Tax=Marinovum sp. TaxID=2024839 RepID=UPI002B270C3A|nr:hypothetical protein [Marinovum sp.]